LSEKPRSKDGIDVSEEFTQMLTNQPVVQWSETLNLADMPHDYFVVFGSFLCTLFTIIFPETISMFLINKLASAILKPH
jgi:hypothetical protein